MTRSQSPKALMAPSMTEMSKEEKAAEMATRKEECEQAHLSKCIPDLWLFLTCVHYAVDSATQGEEGAEGAEKQ